VYELRIYVTNEGKLDDLLTRFRDHTLLGARSRKGWCLQHADLRDRA
jgi:hypothetical protein